MQSRLSSDMASVPCWGGWSAAAVGLCEVERARWRGGSPASFSGAQDLANRTGGALFVGPTNNNVLWSRFTAERDEGSPAVLPVYDRGETVRFAAQAADFDEPVYAWARILAPPGWTEHDSDRLAVVIEARSVNAIE